MQRVSIVCVGKLSERFYADGVREYAKRLQPLCRFEVLEVAEGRLDEKNASPALVQAALEKEAGRLLAAVPKGAKLAALCVEGRQMSSERFAAWLEEAALSGAGDVAFAIGSSHGLAESVKQKALLHLSLSEFTLPHQMARLVLAEQLYRAFMIRGGSRYHK